MMEELTTTSQVIKALDGNVAVAGLTGCHRKAVWNWNGFETFPSRTYVVMINALHRKGKTAPASLWGMTMPVESASA